MIPAVFSALKKSKKKKKANDQILEPSAKYKCQFLRISESRSAHLHSSQNRGHPMSNGLRIGLRRADVQKEKFAGQVPAPTPTRTTWTPQPGLTASQTRHASSAQLHFRLHNIQPPLVSVCVPNMATLVPSAAWGCRAVGVPYVFYLLVRKHAAISPHAPWAELAGNKDDESGRETKKMGTTS